MRSLAFAWILLTWLCACAGTPAAGKLDAGWAEAQPSAARESGDFRGRAENRFFDDAGDDGLVDADPAASPTPKPRKRLMIYSAELQVEVPRTDEAIASARETAESIGGFLATRRGPRITLRVPADRFESFLASMRELGRVLDESMQAQDVTKQHRDLKIRLENARKSRDRLLALLETATKVEDVLKIEKELHRLTEEIERSVATLASLDERIAFSTVAVEFRSIAPAKSTPRKRKRSRFDWINVIGAPEVLRWF